MNKLFDELQVGDMVWANIPISEANVEYSHKIYPYLVAGIGDGVIYAFYSSCKRYCKLNNYQTHGIDLRMFGYDKSWIQLQNIFAIPVDNLRCKMIHLADYDLAMIEKKLQIQSNYSKKSNLSFNIPIRFAAGDVIVSPKDSKKYYYVFSAEGNKLICYPISTHSKNTCIKVKVNERKFFINFAEKIIINNIDNVKIVNIANNTEILTIEKQKKGFDAKAKKDVEEVEGKLIGTIFATSQGKMMYLYEAGGLHYGVNLIAGKVVPSINQIRDIGNCEVVEVYDSDKIEEVVKFLYDCLGKPNQKLMSIYTSMI